MSGIYFHIPFCKKACTYCDFHFSTSLKQKEPVFQTIIKELSFRLNSTNWKEIESIYFGGGTPSLLQPHEINQILELIDRHFPIQNAEITLEANPDDLSRAYLKEIKEVGVNRLSIGIQSFHDEDLQWMNRSHDSKQAEACLKHAAELGFLRLNLDLIFGYPLLSDEKWEENIRKALSFPINHLSTYSMTVEDRTALSHAIKTKKTAPMEEGQAERQYRFIMNYLRERGWKHYEVSNFSLENYESKHNSSYWEGKEYLGIGPSAHGYIGNERYWNIANNAQYIRGWEEDKPMEERETLSFKDRHNEYLMTRLRTAKGFSTEEFETLFGKSALNEVRRQINQSGLTQYFETTDKQMKMSQEGFLIADFVISHLFQA